MHTHPLPFQYNFNLGNINISIKPFSTKIVRKPITHKCIFIEAYCKSLNGDLEFVVSTKQD